MTVAATPNPHAHKGEVWGLSPLADPVHETRRAFVQWCIAATVVVAGPASLVGWWAQGPYLLWGTFRFLPWLTVAGAVILWRLSSTTRSAEWSFVVLYAVAGALCGVGLGREDQVTGPAGAILMTTAAFPLPMLVRLPTRVLLTLLFGASMAGGAVWGGGWGVLAGAEPLLAAWALLAASLVSVGQGVTWLVGRYHAAVDALEDARAKAEREKAQLEEQSSLLADRVQGLASRVARARDEERQRIAHELHDDVGGAIAALAALVHGISASSPGLAEGPTKVARDLSKDVLARVRSLAHAQTSTANSDLREAARARADAAAVAWGLELIFRWESSPSLDAEGQGHVLAFLTEALTNAGKHSGGRSVLVAMEEKGARWWLSVADDGAGLPADRKEGLGMQSLRRRAKALGGAVRFGPATWSDGEHRVESGTEVVLWIPGEGFQG